MSDSKPPEPPKLTTSANATRAELAVEAMRRATLEATTGPRELRSGRFNPYPAKPAAAE
jgi:hypothetical protein